MVARNTEALKSLIYSTLTSNLSLVALLGSASKIKQGSPKQISEYPCVCYNLIGAVDEPFNPDQPTGISEEILRIEIFSSESSTKQADEISDLVYSILHGARLSNDEVITYSCYRTGYTQAPEPETNTTHIIHRYSVKTAFYGS